MTTSFSTRFQSAAASHTGKRRAHNEDAFLDNAAIGLWVVADGMGGHEAGEFASATLVEHLAKVCFPQSASQLLADCKTRIVEANTLLFGIASERRVTIGTTLVALLAYDLHYACIWSGDSRIYRIRDAAITQVTRDHTQVQELVDQGLMTEEESRISSKRNVVTRAIGVTPDLQLEMKQGDLLPNDIFVLCSDGLTTHVEDHEIFETVAGAEPQNASDALIALALARGGLDNVTVLVVRHQGKI
jgi:protein phosphatase